MEGLKSESALTAQWGFLKNIINIDAFFSAGAMGPGCTGRCAKEAKE